MTETPTGYQYGECRLLGHAWHTVPSDWTPQYGVPMTVRCERCNIERRDSVNRYTGEVESRRYEYPDGYLFSRGPDDLDFEKPRRVDFRLDWLNEHVANMNTSRQQPEENDR